MSAYNSQKVVEFYNAYCGKLAEDFVHGNERMGAAIRCVLKWIPNNAKQIMDIGCGIGWSGHEIKRHFPTTQGTIKQTGLANIFNFTIGI